MWWIISMVCVGPLIYLLVSSRDERRDRQAKLERIRRRLAELDDGAAPSRHGDEDTESS